MDLNAITAKLEKLQSKPQKKEKKDFSLTQWKPEVGKHNIRIVPSMYDPQNPFSELKFYYEFNPKMILSPLSYGEKDPIAMLAAKLREAYSAENYALAKQISPKVRIYVPVIVRGEEEKGVRLWGFGKTIYEELLTYAADEEVGDYTDIASGRDFKVEVIGKESTGTDYNKTTIRPGMKTSPLGTKEQVKKWLAEQPNPIDEFKHYTFDELKGILEKFINPEEIEHDETTFIPELERDEEDKNTPSTSKFTLNVKNLKQTKEKKFDALFDDDKTQETKDITPSVDPDDLPF